MTDTANLGLPCIEGSQAQKHVTHNEALRLLDTLVQLAVNDRDLAVPPASPSEGERWIVKTGATDAWAGRVNDIAAWQDGGWQFSAPRPGWLAYIIDEGALLAWSGVAWIDALSAMTSLNNMTLLGLGTTANGSNPLSAKLNNALFVAKTVAEGGDGHLRYKLSKESAAKTLSLLFQDNFSGRAEVGLTGDDDLRFKVSADGATWRDGIVIDRTSGAVTFPNTVIGREVLSADRTYYVRADGSDANNGLANTSGGAWLTLQKAMDAIAAALDVAGRTVTVQIGDGTYAAGVSLKPWVGGGALVFQGNATTPANVLVSCTATHCFENARGALPGIVTIKNMKLTATGAGHAVIGSAPCKLVIDGVNFGAALIHMLAHNGVTIDVSRNYTVSGGAIAHWYCSGGLINNIGAAPTITLTGTPAFTSAFAVVAACGVLYCNGHIFSGAATGSRYDAKLNGVIQTLGGATFLPGNSAGTTATGGQYI